MKVRELIQRLERENPEAEVVLQAFLGKPVGATNVRAEMMSGLRYWQEGRPDGRATDSGDAGSLFRQYPAVIIGGF